MAWTLLKIKIANETRKRTARRSPQVTVEKGFNVWKMVLEGRGFLVMMIASLGLGEL